MTITLVNCQIELSRQIGDFWNSSTTSAGDSTSLIDTLLKQYPNDWITDWTWDRITKSGHTAVDEERRISSLDNTSGDATLVTAHGAATGSGTSYEIHRLFTASEKRRALVAAARRVFPVLFDRVLDESHVTGNWLKDGSFERWTSSSNLTDWAENTVTVTQTTTAHLFLHGKNSAKLSGTAGNIKQTVSENDDLKYLEGSSVTYTIRGHCDTASCLRIAIYDGTDTTYSDYHPGTSDWTADTLPMTVTAFVANTPTAVEFQILQDVSSANSYVDDARAISSTRTRTYIGDLALANKRPHQVFYSREDVYSQNEPWVMIHGVRVDEDDYMYIPGRIPTDRTMRIRGIQYLDFLKASAVSTDWDATINITSEQLELLVSEAALYLYTFASMPNEDTGRREVYQSMAAYWQQENEIRKRKYRMVGPGATVTWGYN